MAVLLMHGGQVHDEDVPSTGQKRVFLPPGGDPENPHINAAECIIEIVQGGPFDGAVRLMVPWELDEGDLEKIKAAGRVWLVLYGNVMPVHSIGIEEQSEREDVDAASRS